MCSDLISRKDVLDAVNDCGICIQRILDIPSAEPERKWMPVSEALPEEGRYLVTRYDYVTKSSFIDILWFEKNTWWDRQITGNFSVLAWMPLPESYKGD